MRRLVSVSVLALVLLVAAPAAALGCGGLIAPGHAEVLRKATTLAAWHDGYEHYVTGFQFAGSANRFGYIIPLPGVPTKIQKGGEWTLERLDQEVNPVERFALQAAAIPSAKDVDVLQRVKVEALNIVVVRGGGRDVAAWAKENGFDLTPDTPHVMASYSSQGAIFALAKFDNKEAVKRGLVEGEGTVIHFTIPMKAPWIPLRILALGKGPAEVVNADLYVLTDDRPSLSLNGQLGDSGITVRKSEPASEQLLGDLRSDRGMKWLPTKGMWFTALTLESPAKALAYDLSIDGGGPPAAPRFDTPIPTTPRWAWALIVSLGVGGIVGMWLLWRPAASTVR
ncbi:MAG TPA: DUF2330 domain-containing protein [Actinomycetota bacterium]|nr:DUF2330 domain-containing protein [Actinomycetota bacterium]